MVDLRWLLSACPDLARVERLIVVHGEDPLRCALGTLGQAARGLTLSALGLSCSALPQSCCSLGSLLVAELQVPQPLLLLPPPRWQGGPDPGRPGGGLLTRQPPGLPHRRVQAAAAHRVWHPPQVSDCYGCWASPILHLECAPARQPTCPDSLCCCPNYLLCSKAFLIQYQRGLRVVIHTGE